MGEVLRKCFGMSKLQFGWELNEIILVLSLFLLLQKLQVPYAATRTSPNDRELEILP